MVHAQLGNEIIEARKRYRLVGCLALAMTVCGCASWKDSNWKRGGDLEPALASNQPQIAENKKSIVLDIEFINVDSDRLDEDVAASLWQWVDETPIDAALRSRLMANGLRVGMIASEERFRDRLSVIATEKDVVDQFLATASVASEVSRGKKRIPMRMGKRYELPLGEPDPGIQTALVRINGETIGKSLTDPQYLLAIEPVAPTAQQQFQLHLRPEIQHGEMRQTVIGGDSAFRIDRRRQTWPLETLALDIIANQGDVLVIAPTTPAAGLGRSMLSGINADNQEEQIIVMIRVDRVPTAVDLL